MYPPACLINGQATDLISSRDRGLGYGDGVFETMAVIDGQFPLWAFHTTRLQHACQRLQLPCPSIDLLHAECGLLAKGHVRAIIKLIVTRGEGGRGYAMPAGGSATRILQRHPWPMVARDNWEPGVKVRFCDLTLARQPALAGIKHLNRLEQVMARAEWQDPTIQEGLLTDSEGCIIEAVSHNVFIVNGETVATPDLRHCGVAGVMREYILSMLREAGYSPRISTLRREDILRAEGVFLCNSIHGIWPVCAIAEIRYARNRVVCDLRDRVAQVIPYP